MVEDEIYKETQLLESVADATRTYVKDLLRPHVAALMPPDGFMPQAMSTSYVGREVMSRIRERFTEFEYRLMFETSQDTITIIDDQERVRDINSAGIALFGFMDRAEALRSAESGKAPDIEALVQASDIPAKTRQGYRPWVTLLVEHYRDLLLAHGSSYPALVKSTYKTRTNYLLFLNRLNQVEQDFDSALKPHLETSTEDVNGIIKVMEESVTSLRRQLAEAIFP